MSVNSAGFLLFLAAGVVLYYAVPKKVRYLVLLAASVCFYLFYSVKAAVYLLVTVVLTYVCGLGLGALRGKEEKEAYLIVDKEERRALKRSFRRRRRLLLGLVLALNFATLALFKYLGSWIIGVNRIFGTSFRPLKLLLPLGISFYIFQTAGYLIDVYRGRQKCEKNFLKYTLFAIYFPQMIQGPINRFGSLADDLFGGSSFNADNIRFGIQLMLWGMLKKAFIADTLSVAVGEIYTNFTEYPGASVLLGVALYCIQLYADFSGGTDLVRGASQLFGVNMAENFRRPYLSSSLDEFWRRWHISLGEWMKDYLFYPLALSGPMNRLSKAVRRRVSPELGKLIVPSAATVVVFLAVGIWQGPGLSNVVYGLWNGVLMSLALLMEKPFRRMKGTLHIKEDSRGLKVFGVFRTCLIVIIGRYFSRSDSLRQACRMLWRTVRYFGDGGLGLRVFTGFGIGGGAWCRILIACAVLLCVSLIQERGVRIRETLAKRHWTVQFILLFAALFLLVVFVYLNRDYTAIAYVYENI